MDEKIFTGTDKALEEGFGSYEARMRFLPTKLRGLPTWHGETCEDPSVEAYIDHGAWLAVCECGGAEYVDPAFPYFFCFGCGNERTGGAARRAIFPDEATMQEVETVLIERPIRKAAGLTGVRAVRFGKAEQPGWHRNWRPGEEVKGLREENEKRTIVAGHGNAMPLRDDEGGISNG